MILSRNGTTSGSAFGRGGRGVTLPRRRQILFFSPVRAFDASPAEQKAPQQRLVRRRGRTSTSDLYETPFGRLNYPRGRKPSRPLLRPRIFHDDDSSRGRRGDSPDTSVFLPCAGASDAAGLCRHNECKGDCGCQARRAAEAAGTHPLVVIRTSPGAGDDDLVHQDSSPPGLLLGRLQRIFGKRQSHGVLVDEPGEGKKKRRKRERRDSAHPSRGRKSQTWVWTRRWPIVLVFRGIASGDQPAGMRPWPITGGLPLIPSTNYSPSRSVRNAPPGTLPPERSPPLPLRRPAYFGSFTSILLKGRGEQGHPEDHPPRDVLPAGPSLG